MRHPALRPLVLPTNPALRQELRSFGQKLFAHNPDNRFCCAQRALNELAKVRAAYQAQARPCPDADSSTTSGTERPQKGLPASLVDADEVGIVAGLCERRELCAT